MDNFEAPERRGICAPEGVTVEAAARVWIHVTLPWSDKGAPADGPTMKNYRRLHG